MLAQLAMKPMQLIRNEKVDKKYSYSIAALTTILELFKASSS